MFDNLRIEQRAIFRSVNTDETYPFSAIHNQRIAIDYTFHNTVITVDGSSAVGNATASRLRRVVRIRATILLIVMMLAAYAFKGKKIWFSVVTGAEYHGACPKKKRA
jgi:hypothetical protein